MPHEKKSKDKNLPRGSTTLRKTPFAGTQSPRGDLKLSPWTTPSKKERKHPLALSGGRHPPERSEKPKFTQDAPVEPSKAPQTAKAPSGGTMSHTPANASQRASVTSGSDKASQQIISGTEAVNRAGDEAARKKMERLLWGIGVGGGN